jgi:hypothetical protein
MSNVLIGIIGVILFIGLALAGALFLGPRFQQSKISSSAAASVQALSQAANAVQLYNVNEGRRFPAGGGSVAVGSEYLKKQTLQPSPNFGIIDVRNADGSYDGDGDYVLMGGSADLGVKECNEIAKQLGMTMDADGGAPKSDKPIGSRGCYRLRGTWGPLSGDGNTFPIAYARI